MAYYFVFFAKLDDLINFNQHIYNILILLFNSYANRKILEIKSAFPPLIFSMHIHDIIYTAIVDVFLSFSFFYFRSCHLSIDGYCINRCYAFIDLSFVAPPLPYFQGQYSNRLRTYIINRISSRKRTKHKTYFVALFRKQKHSLNTVFRLYRNL
jgi:hypothetical protein